MALHAAAPRALRALAIALSLTALALLGCGDDSSGSGSTSNAGFLPANSGGGDVGLGDTGDDDAGTGDDDAGTGDDASTGDDTGDTAVFTFPGEAVACTPNTSYEAQRPILAGGKNNPSGRGEQAGIYDPCNQRVIVFGGNDLQPQECDSFGPKNYLADTWAYASEFENWYRITADTAPSARGRHAYAFDLSRKQLLIFGGRFRPTGQDSGNYALYDDLWAFDVNTDTWTEVQPTSDAAPRARTNSAMVYDEVGDRVILFGGNSSRSGLNFTPLDDTWVFDPKTQAWTEIDTQGTAPPARLFHAATMDHNRNQLLIFSGGDENAFFGPFFSDVWALDLDTMRWRELWTLSGGDGPRGRINAQLLEDRANDRIIMIAGHDDTALGNSNDVWFFDPDDATWTLTNPGDIYTGAGCSSFCQCSEDFVEFDPDSPERRQYHTLVPIRDASQALLFGGTGDCGYIDDTWVLNYADASWEEIQAPEQGIACARTGRSDCEDLCY